MADHSNYCDQAEEDDLSLRYLAGELTASEAEGFELHYFGCARCFEQLEAARLVKKTLSPGKSNARRFSSWLAIAALVAFASSGLWVLKHRPPSAPPASPPAVSAAKPNVALLAKFDPPHYEDQAMRGAANTKDKRFRQAMHRYTKGEFEAASSDLDLFLKKDPDFVPARFYAASAKLLANHPEQAASDFQIVLDSKNADFREEALWGLANAALMENEAPRAENYLAAVARGNGLFSRRAKELLMKVAP